jgi:hypothetical protein
MRVLTLLEILQVREQVAGAERALAWHSITNRTIEVRLIANSCELFGWIVSQIWK